MQNYLLMKASKEAEEVCKKFGYSETLFVDEDFVIIKGDNRRKVLSEIHKNKDKKTIFIASSEEMLRFVLEKTPVDIIMGMEGINKKDSLHYLRGGLDQISCKIAATKGKIIAFSFNSILQTKDSKLLRRMAFNIALCKKFKVQMMFLGMFTNLKDLRSSADLKAFWRVLEQGNRNIYK
jgi:RNase P/RNase MRP subunit p30